MTIRAMGLAEHNRKNQNSPKNHMPKASCMAERNPL